MPSHRWLMSILDELSSKHLIFRHNHSVTSVTAAATYQPLHGLIRYISGVSSAGPERCEPRISSRLLSSDQLPQ